MADLDSIAGTQSASDLHGRARAALLRLSEAVTEADCYAGALVSIAEETPPMAFVLGRMVDRIANAADQVEEMFLRHLAVTRADHGGMGAVAPMATQKAAQHSFGRGQSPALAQVPAARPSKQAVRDVSAAPFLPTAENSSVESTG